MAVRWSVRLVLAAVAGGHLAARPASAQGVAAAGRSSVVGLVRDSAGQPIAGALVRFEALGRGVVTGDDGRFAVTGLRAGPLAGGVRRLGYLPGDFVLQMPPGVQVSVEVRMAASPTRLPSVVVDGERRDFLLMANGYYDRARASTGTFLGPEFLEARRGVSLHTLLREVPRVRVVCDPVGLRCDPMFARPGATCAPRLWVDGVVAPAGVVDEIVPRDRVRAVEVYPSAAFVPGDFVRPGDLCGVIAIWTEQAPTWSRYLPRQVVSVPVPPPAPGTSAP